MTQRQQNGSDKVKQGLIYEYRAQLDKVLNSYNRIDQARNLSVEERQNVQDHVEAILQISTTLDRLMGALP